MNNNQPRLLEQVRNVIRVRHYSMSTEEAYVNWIRRFIYYHKKRHPLEMGAKEVEAIPLRDSKRTSVASGKYEHQAQIDAGRAYNETMKRTYYSYSKESLIANIWSWIKHMVQKWQ